MISQHGMGKVVVPAPPQASFEKNLKRERQGAAKTNTINVAASQRNAPLDAAFLGRVYRVCLSFGVVLAACSAVVSRDIAWPLSCLAGLLSGVLALKTQELFVRRLVRPQSWPAYDGADKKLPVWLIVPGKYALIVAAILLMRRAELLNFVAFSCGFVAVQLILLSMALSRLLVRRRSIHEIYVQPHMVQSHTVQSHIVEN